MKLCPKCSTKNDDTANFCKGCGENLSEAPATQKNTTSETPVQQDKNETWQALSSPNSGWDKAEDSSVSKSVNVKWYPFFRDEDESTVAVIGERSIPSALEDRCINPYAVVTERNLFEETTIPNAVEGRYTNPYAVLTQRRLYCKNEAGNFITEITDIRTIQSKGITPETGHIFCLVGMFISTIGSVFPLLASPTAYIAIWLPVIFASFYFYFRNFCGKETPQNWIIAVTAPFIAMIGACISYGMSNRNGLDMPYLLLWIVLSVPWMYTTYKYVSSPITFFIQCTGGTFSFPMENYPQQEFSDFCKQLARLCPEILSCISYGPTSYGTYQKFPRESSGTGKRLAAIICVLVILTGVVGFAWYSLTHCKNSNCDSDVYKDGFCEYHYRLYQVDNAAHDAYDGVNGFLDELLGD